MEQVFAMQSQFSRWMLFRCVDIFFTQLFSHSSCWIAQNRFFSLCTRVSTHRTYSSLFNFLCLHLQHRSRFRPLFMMIVIFCSLRQSIYRAILYRVHPLQIRSKRNFINSCAISQFRDFTHRNKTISPNFLIKWARDLWATSDDRHQIFMAWMLSGRKTTTTNDANSTGF